MGVTYTSNEYLEQYGEEMTANAEYIFDYFTKEGWTTNSICAMLGNMQRESTINPGVWQSLDEGNLSGGFGLVQWTPATVLINWCTEKGKDYEVIWNQCDRIMYELENGVQWYSTSAFPESFEEFTQSTESVEYLTECFLKNYERAGVEALHERITYASHWFEYFEGEIVSFIPRKTSDGIRGSYYWYDGNPFYQAGYGLPNCTCYAYGRFWEISDRNGTYENKPNLSTGNAGLWYAYDDGYERGTAPKLGAVACYDDISGGAGHVAIVEEILENGDILVSQSAYGGSFFYTNKKLASNGYSYKGMDFQGFIYNPFASQTPGEPEEPTTKKKKKHFSFILMNRRKRVNG